MGMYEIIKDAAAVAKEAGKIEQYKQILEVLEKMLDMQKRIEELEIDNNILRKQLSTKKSVKYERNSYWTDDGTSDGPFCSKCSDSDGEMVRTHPCGNPAYHACPD